MAYRIELTKEFHKALGKQPREAAGRVLRYLKDLDGTEDPRTKGKPLTGPLRGFWRYRVGDYRIVCEIRDDELVVIALMVGHRRDVYKR